jgi:hypothetical protein
MRNPLLNAHPQNTSQTEQTDSVPTPDLPILERYEGDNIPYRGTEQHGVEWDQGDQRQAPGYEGREAIVYEAPPKETDPIPVRIVEEESARELRRMRTVVQYAGGSDSGTNKLLLGRDESRSFVKIKNPNAEVVYLTNGRMNQEMAILNGYPLIENETYETRSQDEVYAAVDLATDVPVPMIIEYSAPL